MVGDDEVSMPAGGRGQKREEEWRRGHKEKEEKLLAVPMSSSVG
jgi:hypothetical protein